MFLFPQLLNFIQVYRYFFTFGSILKVFVIRFIASHLLNLHERILRFDFKIHQIHVRPSKTYNNSIVQCILADCLLSKHFD